MATHFVTEMLLLLMKIVNIAEPRVAFKSWLILQPTWKYYDCNLLPFPELARHNIENFTFNEKRLALETLQIKV